MKRATAALTVAALSLWATAAFAQGRNFSGNWTLDVEKMAASGGVTAVAGGRGGGGAGGGTMVAAGGGGMRGGGGAGGGGSAATVIALDATSFTVSGIAYKLDSTTSIERMGRTITAKTAWKGDKLVIEESSQSSNGPIVSTTTWYLEGDSLVREVSTASPNGGDPQVRKFFYKKS